MPPKMTHGVHILTATEGSHKRKFNVGPWKGRKCIGYNMLQLSQDGLY